MRPAILVHGGAGPLGPDDDEASARLGCLEAARRGHHALREGRGALDAVELACRLLEDDPCFNAGTGAALGADGQVELDASLMDGATLRAGAVAAVRTVKNPVSAARLVMELSPHVLLVGPGAEAFLHRHGVPGVDPQTLITERALARWHRGAGLGLGHGTIGAVAVDQAGHVAAATSTGGTSGKLPGRVGDSPLVGCGTYADDRTGAASATGVGEYIIRVALTHLVTSLLGQGLGAQLAAQRGVDEVVRLGGEAGVIVATPRGELAWAFSSERMARAWVNGDGREGAGFGPAT
jgi:L-asparaginase / beta-aspartyl-peptidase